MHTAPVRRSLGRGLTNQGRNDDPQGPVAERDVEREGDSLVRSLSYLFSWREMLSYLLPPTYLPPTLPYLIDVIARSRQDHRDIERHDAFLAYAAGGAPPPLTRSQTRLNDVHLPRHSTAPSNCLIRLRRSFVLPPTRYLLPATSDQQQQAPAPLHACLPSDDRSGEDCQEATSTCTLPATSVPFHPSIVIWNKAWRG